MYETHSASRALVEELSTEFEVNCCQKMGALNFDFTLVGKPLVEGLAFASSSGSATSEELEARGDVVDLGLDVRW